MDKLNKIIHFLEGMPMTIVSGIALAISLVLMLCHVDMDFDPAWITVFISGVPLLWLAVTRLIFQRWVSSALLISVAMFACIYIGELFAAGEVAWIMALGALLEEYSVNRARRGLGKLIALAPSEANLVTAEGEKTVPISEVCPSDIIRVLPGERIAVDGVVVNGNTSVDQSVMTGESLPVDKTVGDEVYCGTMNCYGSMDVRATNVGKDSSLQKMIQLVKEADEKKAPMQRIVDKWATWLVPIAILIAVVTWIVTGNMERGVTVLVVFCPCALALATPVSIIAGIGQATKFGVLIKSGEALEAMGKVNCITFDKTGTLTEGKLTVSDIVSFDPAVSQEELLLLTASAEARSEHPLGKAIVAQADKMLKEVDNFTMQPGKGISADIDGKNVLCGKSSFIQEHGISLNPDIEASLTLMRSQGKATVVTAVDGKAIGIIGLSDVIRPAATDMTQQLASMGVETVMLTGDNHLTAEFIASKAGISRVKAELLPTDKVGAVRDLQSEGKIVCMIGDGVNDAPALKTANVGVAMGGMGSDIAIESADIALMGDDISKIPYLKRLSLAVVKSIKLNITLSMAINFIAITCSVMGWLNPVTGALVHNAGSVLVVLNAALLYDRKI